MNYAVWVRGTVYCDWDIGGKKTHPVTTMEYDSYQPRIRKQFKILRLLMLLLRATNQYPKRHGHRSLPQLLVKTRAKVRRLKQWNNNAKVHSYWLWTLDEFSKNRVRSFVLGDLYICTILLIGLILLILSTVFWAKGAVNQPITYRTLLTSEPNSATGQFERGVVFFTLPTLLFSLFNNTFVFSDNYHRTMIPIQNMAKKGTAEDTMLLDYISTDPVTTVMNSLRLVTTRLPGALFLQQPAR